MENRNYRANDPWSARLGSELNQSDWESTRKAVANLMLDYEPHSIQEQRFVGGTQGDRRRRELEHDFGWPIDKHPNPDKEDGRGPWLYQLTHGTPFSIWPPGTWGHSRDLIHWQRSKYRAPVIDIKEGGRRRRGNY